MPRRSAAVSASPLDGALTAGLPGCVIGARESGESDGSAAEGKVGAVWRSVMGFDLNAFLGRASELRTWKGRLPSAVVCQPGGELGLVPVTGKLVQDLRTWLGQEEANRLG